jgi:hypothetical protein
VILGRDFTAEGAGSLGVVSLHDARIGGQLQADGCTVSSKTNREDRWTVDGLTYSEAPQLALAGDRDAWLELLRTGTPRYAAQPYQQLAAAYRTKGHDSDAWLLWVVLGPACTGGLALTQRLPGAHAEHVAVARELNGR